MIILDTNVISEFMRPGPDEAVVAWLDRQSASAIWTTSITIFEVEFGLQKMPRGKRRKVREEQFQEMIATILRGRVLDFDTEAAIASGALGAASQADGRPIEIRDLQIAGIARARNATVATRNVKHFHELCQVRNPWEDA